MSTTGAAALSVAIAIQTSSAAHTAECNALVKGYTHSGTTVMDQQEYARCIQHLYPEPMSIGQVVLVKVLIVSVFVGVAFGFWLARRSREDIGGTGLYTALWAVVAPFAVLCLSAAAYGLLFLFEGGQP